MAPTFCMILPNCSEYKSVEYRPSAQTKFLAGRDPMTMLYLHQQTN